MSNLVGDHPSHLLHVDLGGSTRLATDVSQYLPEEETKGSIRSESSFRVARDVIDADTKYSSADSAEKFQDAADHLRMLPNYVELLQNPLRNPVESLPFEAPLPQDFYQFMLDEYEGSIQDEDEGGESDDAQLKMPQEELNEADSLSIENVESDGEIKHSDEYKKAIAREEKHEKEQREFLRKRIDSVSDQSSKEANNEHRKVFLNQIKLKASISYLSCFQNDMTHLKSYLESLEESLREYFPRYRLKKNIKKKNSYDHDDFRYDQPAFKVLTEFKGKNADLKLSDRQQKNQLLKFYIELCETHHTLNYVYRLLCFHKGRAIDYQNVFMQPDYNDPTQAVAYRYSRTLRCKIDGPSEAFVLRAFRKNFFPLLNVIRLTFLVRIENVIDKFALLIGSPISQHVYIHMVDAFSWTQFLGWIFYLPRIIINISIAFHNAWRSSAFNQAGLAGWKKIQRFFSMLWHNTSERRWQQFNDFAWAIIGLCTCFIPSASVLTPLLYLYDIVVAVSQHLQTVHMWDSKRRYAASLCLNFQRGIISDSDALASIAVDPVISNPFEKAAGITFGSHMSVKGVIDLVTYPKKSIGSHEVNFYLSRLNLIRLYQHMCYQVLSVNADNLFRDCSVWSVPELHRRALAAWTFHVSAVIALMEDGANDVQQKMRSVYHSVKALSFTLPFHITKKMKVELKAASQHFASLDLKNIANSHPALRRYFSLMTKRYRSAKTSLVRDAIVTTCLALGMIGGFLGSGASVFGLVSMPSIPLLAVISLGAVFLTSLSSLIMNRTGTPTIQIKGA